MKTALLAVTLAAFAGLATAQAPRARRARRAGLAGEPRASLRHGQTRRLPRRCPICLISAPAAKYRIEAFYGGVKRSAQVAANAKQARVVFAFPDEPWDGIKASDEEKQQARTQ